MIKAIIFDSDDTILDFSIVACPVVQETAKKLNLRIPENDEINKLWGMPLGLFLKELWQEVNINEFKKNYYHLIEQRDFNEIEGTKDTLRLLHAKYILGVLTTKPEYLMYDNFKSAGFNLDLFKFMYGAEHSQYRKPDPKVFDKSLEVLELEPKMVLYVGDSMFDCEAALNAGINFVAVETGYYKEKDFVGNGVNPKNVIKSVKYLPKWLNGEFAIDD